MTTGRDLCFPKVLPRSRCNILFELQQVKRDQQCVAFAPWAMPEQVEYRKPILLAGDHSPSIK
jgi:hypothetical protein